MMHSLKARACILVGAMTAGLALAAYAQAPLPAAPQTAIKPQNVRPGAVAAPAATPLSAPPGAAATFQTGDQLQKAGVKRCLQMAQAIGKATLVGTTEYAAASTWYSKQPDGRFSVSMIGQKFGKDGTASAGLSGVFSSPTTDGKCDAAAIQIIPTGEPCTTAQAQILQKGRSLGDLAGVPILQNASNAQVMLIPAANNGCVLVALSTVYTE